MKANKFRYYVCRKLKLLTHLLNKGYVYIKIDKDKYNPKHNIWLFEETPELLAEVNRYYKEYQKGSENRNSSL